MVLPDLVHRSRLPLTPDPVSPHTQRPAVSRQWRRPPGRLGPQLAVIAVALVIELTMAGLHGETRFGFTVPGWVLALVAALVFGTLLWRVRFPWAVYLITFTHAIVLSLVVPSYQPFMGVLAGLYSVARIRPRREAISALALTSVVWGINTYNTTTFNEGIATPVGAFAVFSLIAVAVFSFARAKRRLDEFEVLRSRVWESDVALRLQEDRVTTARDLHDRVSNSIAATLMGLDSLSLFKDELSPRAMKSLDLTRSAAQQSMHEIRDVLGVLRATEDSLEDGDDQVHLDLEEMFVELQRNGVAGVEVEVTHKGAVVELGDHVQECAAHCIREAVTNAAKYGVAQIEIGIDWRDDPIVVTVRNANGARQLPDPSLRGGLGLGGIIERVTSIGGGVGLEAKADAFTLRLRLPRG